MKAMTAKDAKTLLEAADGRDRDIILAVIGTQRSVSEVLGIRKGDIGRRSVRFGDEDVIVPATTLKVLRKRVRKKAPDALVFPGRDPERPASRTTFWYAFKILLGKAGLSSDYSPSSLRFTRAVE